MIHKAHTLEQDTNKPWPPDVEFPNPVQDLDALYFAAQSAFEAYNDAVRKWERTKEETRLAAWVAFHTKEGWPRDVTYRERLEKSIADMNPVAVKPPREG